MNNKICIKCGKLLPATTEYFHVNKRGKLGLTSQCKLCVRVTKRPKIENCEECGKKLTRYRQRFCCDLHQRKWHGRNDSRSKAEAHKKLGLCRNCSRPAENGTVLCGICNKRKKELCKKKRHEYKKLVLEYYGHKCECCGEFRSEFLAVDHINGGGKKHRRKIGENIHYWLVRNNFPKGFRLLCHNCNQSFGSFGYCPHNVERQQMAELEEFIGEGVKKEG